MTNEEAERSSRLNQLIRQYEAELDKESQRRIHEEINEISEVTDYELNEYWRSTSLEDFCNSLAVEVVHGANFSKEEAISIVKEMCLTLPDDILRFDYLYTKYGTAIEFVFQKSQYLWSAIYEDEKTFEEVMRDLNSAEGGPILL